MSGPSRPADKTPSRAARDEREVYLAARTGRARATRPGPVLRVHIEEVPDSRTRPELLSMPPGRTVFDAVGPREVVACSLRKLARRFDPPWWMFWARLRR